jgi:hypothetical protein
MIIAGADIESGGRWLPSQNGDDGLGQRCGERDQYMAH